MSYTINDLEMIQDFIVRNEKDLKDSEKFEALDKLQKEMERDILYQRHIDSGLPRVFMSDDSLEDKYKEFGMMNNMMAILVDRDENLEFEGLKSKKGQITALVINGRDEENNKLIQPRAEFLGEVIIYDALIKLHSSKDIVELALKYRNKNTDYKPTEVVSTRPAPKPTVEKEVIDSEKVGKAKAELKTSDVNEAFKEIFGEKDENGNYSEFNKFEEDLKKAHNLLGTPSTEDIVEKQVEEAKEKDENKTSLFGGKPFTFGSEDKTDAKPMLKKATKGIKPKFAGFTGTEYMAEDGKVDENGIPLKFANNTAAEEKFGQPAKDGRTSTNIAELVSPETLKIFTQGTHDATEEELKVINNTEDSKPTIFGKPRVEGEYEAPTSSQVVIPNLAHIYFVDEEGMLAGVARDRETEEYIKAHLDELKREGDYIVIENGSMRKLDGSADFSLDEREYLVEQFRNIITDPNVENLGIPKDVIEVMEMEVEDWDNNQEIDNID